MTNNIKTFDKSTLSEVRTAIDMALDKVAKDLGIKLSIGSIRYDLDGKSFSTKLTGNTIGVGGVVETREMSDLKRYGKLYISDKLDINKTYKFMSLGEIKFVGYSARKRKNPVIIKVVSTGKTYVISDDSARRVVEAA